jgi:hypothetical protein
LKKLLISAVAAPYNDRIGPVLTGDINVHVNINFNVDILLNFNINIHIGHRFESQCRPIRFIPNPLLQGIILTPLIIPQLPQGATLQAQMFGNRCF